MCFLIIIIYTEFKFIWNLIKSVNIITAYLISPFIVSIYGKKKLNYIREYFSKRQSKITVSDLGKTLPEMRQGGLFGWWWFSGDGLAVWEGGGGSLWQRQTPPATSDPSPSSSTFCDQNKTNARFYQTAVRGNIYLYSFLCLKETVLRRLMEVYTFSLTIYGWLSRDLYSIWEPDWLLLVR